MSLQLTGLWGEQTNGEGTDARFWLLLIGLCSQGSRKVQVLSGDATFDVLPLQKRALLRGGGGVDHRSGPPDHRGPLPKGELDDGEPLTHLPV